MTLVDFSKNKTNLTATHSNKRYQINTQCTENLIEYVGIMEVCDGLLSKVLMEMSTIVIVKNRCQFYYAFFRDPEKYAEHNSKCEFRFTPTFEGFDGKVKFVCALNTKHPQIDSFQLMQELFAGLLWCVQNAS